MPLEQYTITGVAVSDGPRWVEQRRFALHVLKDLGSGRFVMEDAIRAELADLVAIISATSTRHQDPLDNGQSMQVLNQSTPIDPTQHLNRSIANVLSALVFGARLGGRDPGFDRAVDYILNVLLHMQKVWQIVFLK